MFTQLALQNYLVVAAILFVIGLLGFMTRRNLIVMFLSTEIILQAVVINVVAFRRYHGNFSGQAMAMFATLIAAAEAGLVLALVICLYRRRHTLDSESCNQLRG